MRRGVKAPPYILEGIVKKATRVSAKDARSQLGEIVGRAKYRGEVTIITLRGKDVCAVVPVALFKEMH